VLEYIDPIDRAAQAIDSGAANTALDRWVALAGQLRAAE